ncbi:MAG TPA: GlsB/YeaQ/YmgE family stress response membrane protein [Terracidiphilus sp.]|nr:GlsB/YeaQ/YmgE family stress response membrane protein [Terracidiphilus sp.]
MHFLWWILVGLVAGWLTGKVMKGGGFGFFVDIILGIVGALVGGFIAKAIGFSPQGGLIYTILVATCGAILVVFVFRLITGKRG